MGCNHTLCKKIFQDRSYYIIFCPINNDCFVIHSTVVFIRLFLAFKQDFILHYFSPFYECNYFFTEYLQYADLNVWMIDYSGVSAGPKECYVAAVYNLPSVGKCAAIFVKKIIQLSEVIDRGDEMHAIGFSLGGQLASQLAEYLKPYILPWITGTFNR